MFCTPTGPPAQNPAVTTMNVFGPSWRAAPRVRPDNRWGAARARSGDFPGGDPPPLPATAGADLDVVHRHASRDDRLLDFSRQDREGALYYGTLVGDPALIARQVDGALPAQPQRDDFRL